MKILKMNTTIPQRSKRRGCTLRTIDSNGNIHYKPSMNLPGAGKGYSPTKNSNCSKKLGEFTKIFQMKYL